MSDKPAWLEDWETDADGDVMIIEANGHRTLRLVGWASRGERQDVGRIAAAAPALVRALLLVEWGACDSQYTELPRCPGCEGVGEHYPACPIDAALTLAGFDTTEKRDAARVLLAKEPPP